MTDKKAKLLEFAAFACTFGAATVLAFVAMTFGFNSQATVVWMVVTAVLGMFMYLAIDDETFPRTSPHKALYGGGMFAFVVMLGVFLMPSELKMFVPLIMGLATFASALLFFAELLARPRQDWPVH